MKNKVINQLPVVLQTSVQKKFFDATFEQLFQKKSADTEIGWIGRREGGKYAAENVYFLEEETPTRNNYQVEPIAYSKDPATLEETNIMFYDDFVNYLSQHNGITNNHDRLFKTNSYSFAPPINSDKFINYHNYMWIPGGLAAIKLPTVSADDIVIPNQINTAYTITDGTKTLELSSGMHLVLSDGVEYIAEGIGCDIYLVKLPNQILPFDQFQYLQWDSGLESWDSQSWDAINVGLPYDYITTERGSLDNNGWSRTNRWYHKSVVFAVLGFLEQTTNKYVVASRPILEFKRDILLHNSGKEFSQYITFVVDDLVHSQIHLNPIGTHTYDGGNVLQEDDVILITTGDNAGLYTVAISAGTQVDLISVSANDGDIIIALTGDDYNGTTYFYNVDQWTAAAVQKYGINQAPLFALFDTNGVSLDDSTLYPFASYEGNEIFSYKVNEFSATNDTELGFPLEYSGLGQIGDIVFEHDLESNRAFWAEEAGIEKTEIAGFYYFHNSRTGEYGTTWEIGSTINEAGGYQTEIIDDNKQNVIDRYVINEDGNNTFNISQSTTDISIKLNGRRLSDTEFTSTNNSVVVNVPTLANDVIEFYSYSPASKIDGSRGYYRIPDALESNPTNEVVVEYSQNDMYKHFLSIIENQDGVSGSALGLDNSYRDTCQDMSKGTYMLQTRDPMLLSMLVSSTPELDVINAMRFALLEYTRYKNKFIKTSIELVHEYSASLSVPPAMELFDEVIYRLINATEFDESFKHSYMFAHGANTEEQHAINGTTYTLTDEIVLSESTSMYVYVGTTLQLIDIDYEITNVSPITVEFTTVPSDVITTQLYSDIETMFIPPTPSKLGMSGVFEPSIVLDDSFVTPVEIILGHDGSRTPVYDDANVTNLILEFEKRIFNGINSKFRKDYHPELSTVDIKQGAFRTTQYAYDEYVSVYQQSFTKWSNDVNASWQENETYDAADWKTWNYRQHGVPGYWKGMYAFYYDTHRPHTDPWEMLGFSQKPTWWLTEYGTDFSSNNVVMWGDIEMGIILHGNRQGVDVRYARPDMIVPTDIYGSLITPDIINANYIHTTHSSDTWLVGDCAPVEAAWKTTEPYPFAMAELLFLTKPAQFGSRFWDTLDSTRSVIAPNQYISNETANRRSYSGMLVHGETKDGNIIYRHGYQQFISDRLAFNDTDIKLEFGDRVRRLGVKLGHKMGGFTNPTTVETFLEGTSAESTSNGLLIPKENVSTTIHTSPSIGDFTYSGVVVLAEEDGSYRVFGYDMLDLEFKIIPRSTTAKGVDVTVGQDNEPFRIYANGYTYDIGSIVKYNGIFYSSKIQHTPDSFSDINWTRLVKLPSTGGVSVTYVSQGDYTAIHSIPYGTTLKDEQAVFDFLIGYGDYLESQGWEFNGTDDINFELLNWLKSAKDYLFWVTNSWAPGSIIRLSPASKKAHLNLSRGYAGDLKIKYNGLYSLLDEDGAAIDSKNIIVDRESLLITARGTDQDTTGIYLMRVYSTETEHIVTFDNRTSFSDVIFDPLLGVRQNRLKFIGPRTLGWTGKREAPGYIITDEDKLLPNFDTLVESIRRYHDTESRLDRQEVEDTARHLIGFENKPYLVDLDIRQDTQYQFYQGMVRQKGSPESIDKILRSTNITGDGNQSIEVFEEFAIRLGRAGADCTTQQLDLVIDPSQIKSNPQLVDLNIVNTLTTGIVKNIIPVNSSTVYLETPMVNIEPKLVDLITAGKVAWDSNEAWINNTILPNINTTVQLYFPNPTDGDYANIGKVYFDHALAVVILNDSGQIAEYEITYGGTGYTQEPDVYVPNADWDTSENESPWDNTPWDGGSDSGIAILQFEIVKDELTDDVITLDIDNTDTWLTRPTRGCDKTTLWNTSYSTPVFPTAGYVNTTDVDMLLFQTTDMMSINFADINLISIAKDAADSWAVYKMVEDGGIVGAETIIGEITITDNVIHLPTHNVLANEGHVTIGDATYTFEGTGPYLIKDSNGKDVLTPALLGKSVKVFKNRRYVDLATAELDGSIVVNDTIWVDNDADGRWSVYNVDAIAPLVTSLIRKEEKRVVTKLIKNAFVYDNTSKDTLGLINVYDPVKGFIPGVAERNIDIKSHTDPAKYTNAEDIASINESIRFSKNDIGRTWLDLGSFRYIDYEQSDSRYRRDTWGKMVHGSDLAIYEWVESYNAPDSYDGEGTPYSLTNYTTEEVYSPSANYNVTMYYFWVRGKTSTPHHRANRTTSITSLEQLLTNPKSQGYMWFSLVDEDSFIIANAEHILENNDTSFQINYRTTYADTNLHTEWYLMGEGNRNSPVKDMHWNKLVDSLVGFTDDISTADMPFLDNIAGSDFIGVDPMDANERIYQLAVPDPSLSSAEKYGIEYRPRQSWFVDLQAGRKVFVQSANTLLATIELFDSATFADYVPTSKYWSINDDGYLELSSLLYTDYRLTELRTELRQILNTMKNYIFVGDELVKLNTLFFALTNFVLSEQKDVDWIFKTTYITLNQEAIALEQKPTLTNDPFESLLDYVNEVKPYSTKIRDYKNAFKTSDQANVTIDEYDTKNIKIRFNRMGCEDITTGWSNNVLWDNIPFDHGESATATEAECASNETEINANGFVTPTIPFDILAFDEAAWDSDAPIIYYEAASVIPNTFLPGAPLLSPSGTDFTIFTSVAGAITNIFDLEIPPELAGIDYGTMGVYLNGIQLLNYYIYGDSTTTKIYIMQELAPDDIIDFYTVILPEGDFFLQPQTRFGNPQELVPLIMYEGVVMQVKTDGVTATLAGNTIAEYPIIQGFGEVRVNGIVREDYTIENAEYFDSVPWDGGSGDWDNSYMAIQFSDAPHALSDVIEIDYPELNYRMHVNMTGRVTYDRMCSNNTQLATDFNFGDNTVTLDDASVLPDATVARPKVAWIGPEKISYSGKTGNMLTGVTRGERNTPGKGMVNYNTVTPLVNTQMRKAGDMVWIGGDTEVIPDAKYIGWTDSAGTIIYGLDNTLTLSGTQLAIFLRECP